MRTALKEFVVNGETVSLTKEDIRYMVKRGRHLVEPEKIVPFGENFAVSVHGEMWIAPAKQIVREIRVNGEWVKAEDDDSHNRSLAFRRSIGLAGGRVANSPRDEEVKDWRAVEKNLMTILEKHSHVLSPNQVRILNELVASVTSGSRVFEKRKDMGFEWEEIYGTMNPRSPMAGRNLRPDVKKKSGRKTTANARS